MHCGRGQGPRRSRSLASRYLRRALNYLCKLQGQRRAARVKVKKATMFAHAVEKTTQRTRQEKRPASLRVSVIARAFIAARKMPSHSFNRPSSLHAWAVSPCARERGG